MPRVNGRALSLAAFFVVVQFYTSFASLSPTPPVGYVVVPRPLAAALVTVLVLAALGCGVALVQERALVGRSPSHVALVAWLSAATVAAALGFDPPLGLAVVGMMALAALFHLALVRDFARPGVARTVLAAYLWAGCAATLASLAMALARRPALLAAYNHGRAAGVFVTANQFAAFAVAFGFTALGVALGRRGRVRRLALASAGLAAVGLMATLSVAALLGAAVGGAFYALVLGARRTAAALALALLAGGAFVLLRTPAGHDRAQEFDRLRTWRAGLRVVALFPVTGVGPMAYWRVYPAIRPPNGDPPGTFGALHPHDAYLSLAADTGLLGVGAFVYGSLRLIQALRASLRSCAAAERRLALGACAALVAVGVQGLFDTVGVVAMTYVWIPYAGLALAAARAGQPALEAS